MPNGKILTQSYAILRHWGRQLGAYDGKTEDEKYWADAICDIVTDCWSHSSQLWFYKYGSWLTYISRANSFYRRFFLGQPERGLSQAQAGQPSSHSEGHRDTSKEFGSFSERAIHHREWNYIRGSSFVPIMPWWELNPRRERGFEGIPKIDSVGRCCPKSTKHQEVFWEWRLLGLKAERGLRPTKCNWKLYRCPGSGYRCD